MGPQVMLQLYLTICKTWGSKTFLDFSQKKGGGNSKNLSLGTALRNDDESKMNYLELPTQLERGGMV